MDLVKYISKQGNENFQVHFAAESSFVYVTSIFSGCCTDNAAQLAWNPCVSQSDIAMPPSRSTRPMRHRD